MAFNHFFHATTTSSLLVIVVLVFITASSINAAAYGTKPDYDEKPKSEKQNLLSTNAILGVQGLVYCKSGPKVIPLEGSVARITCEAVDGYGFETSAITMLSDATDAKGYFLATISPSEVENHERLTQCKAFLELSSMDSCNVPTDFNNGVTGAPLASFRLLHHNNMKLYTVGPFTFTSSSSKQPKSSSPPNDNNNGY